MAFVTRTVTGDLDAMFGGEIDYQQVRAVAYTNLPDGEQMVVDLNTGKQYLGTGRLSIGSDGTLTISSIPDYANSSTDQNPTGVQIGVKVEYVDALTRKVKHWDSGLLSVTARTVTDASRTNGSATVTSATAAFTDRDKGRTVTGTGIPANAYILSVTNATTIVLSANATATATGATVTFTDTILGRIISEQTAPPSWQSAFTAEMDVIRDAAVAAEVAAEAAQAATEANINGLGIGTVTTGLPGTDADVTLTGTTPDRDFNFRIPSGEQGLPGPGAAAWTAAQAVTIGSVRQAPDGSWIKATANRTTRPSFDATEQTFWTTVSATSGTLEQAALSASIDARVPAASTTVSGKAELATSAETITGTDAVRATTPAGVAARAVYKGFVARNALDAGVPADGVTEATTAMNAYLTDCLANQRDAYLGIGAFLLDQLIVPQRLKVLGAGIGGFAQDLRPVIDSNTMLLQKAGANKPLVIFQQVGTWSPSSNLGPVTLEHMILRGNPTCTSGSGIEFRSPDGSLIGQDTVTMRNLTLVGFIDDGIRIPNGARPLHLVDINCLWNGAYGVRFQSAAALTQAIHFDNISGDGNRLGLVLCKDMDNGGSVVVTNMKSEKRYNPYYNVISGHGNVGWQENAITFQDCDGTSVSIDGITHVSSVLTGPNVGPYHENPRAAINLSGTNKRPNITFTGVTVRTQDAVNDTGTRYTLKDDTHGAGGPSIPYTVTAGFYGDGGFGFAGPEDGIQSSRLASGEEVMDRSLVKASTVSLATGTGRISYYMARKTETISKVRTITGSVAAGATPTLCKVGVFEVNTTTGDLTLVAVTANTTSLWAATGTAYSTSLVTPYLKIRGRTYAHMLLCVTGATAPQMAGESSLLPASEMALSPRLSAVISGQTDIPSSIAAGSLSATTQRVYSAVEV